MFYEFIPAGYMAMAEVDQSLPWHQRMASYRHGIAPHKTIPQALANAWTAVMVEAIRAFHEEDYEMQPALDYIDDLDDEMVERRIAGYQEGYDKEYNRRLMHGIWTDLPADEESNRGEKLRYVFADLPQTVKRSVVSNWDRLHHEWMAEHPLVHYAPEFGYFWLIEGSVVKMYEEIDQDKEPTEENALHWEHIGSPGGLSGWVLMEASRGAGDIEPTYFGYGDFED